MNETGNPCFLSPEDGASVLTLLADAVEEEQLCDADAARRDGQEVLGNSAADASALRQALEASNRALTDTLRVADSRGDRLADYEVAESERDDLNRGSEGDEDPDFLERRSADGQVGVATR
ncbi:hypothetical protein ACQEU8_14830 [Streptomyces sp. CA-250714]|uniref:hypothetical protein n=1 Tax=Streptomyces sp. CA-250714 TaxID=3240060 RepID=UPI003D8AAB5C